LIQLCLAEKGKVGIQRCFPLQNHEYGIANTHGAKRGFEAETLYVWQKKARSGYSAAFRFKTASTASLTLMEQNAVLKRKRYMSGRKRQGRHTALLSGSKPRLRHR